MGLGSALFWGVIAAFSSNNVQHRHNGDPGSNRRGIIHSGPTVHYGSHTVDDMILAMKLKSDEEFRNALLNVQPIRYS
jgi:hypothetical protein